MKLKAIGSFAAVSLMLFSVRPATAHHSFDAEYDSKKTATISGNVTKLDGSIQTHLYSLTRKTRVAPSRVLRFKWVRRMRLFVAAGSATR